MTTIQDSSRNPITDHSAVPDTGSGLGCSNSLGITSPLNQASFRQSHAGLDRVATLTDGELVSLYRDLSQQESNTGLIDAVRQGLCARAERIVRDACSGDAIVARRYAITLVTDMASEASIWNAPVDALKLRIGSALAGSIFSSMPAEAIAGEITSAIVGRQFEEGIEATAGRYGRSFDKAKLRLHTQADRVARLLLADPDYQYQKVGIDLAE